jgi:hypothetical protein
MAFLIPSVVKIEHRHEHGIPKGNTELPSGEYHDNCVICNFEFSVFLSFNDEVYFEENEHLIRFINDYSSIHFQNLSQYNFLLRAPPSFQV